MSAARAPTLSLNLFAGLAFALMATTGIACSGSRNGRTQAPQKSVASKTLKQLALNPGRPERLPVVARTRGPNDPHDFDLSLLIPPGSRLRQVWFIHGGHVPDQVLVEWVRDKTVSLYGYRFSDAVRWGLTLWTQAPYRLDYQAPWKGVAIPLLRLAPGAPNMRVALGDVTGDGHPDVLVEQYPHTNHGCGPHEVVATLAQGRSWRIFRAADLCETTLHGSRGLLALDLPYYVDGDSVCCWSKVEKIRLRWNGRTFVKAYDRIVPARRS